MPDNRKLIFLNVPDSLWLEPWALYDETPTGEPITTTEPSNWGGAQTNGAAGANQAVDPGGTPLTIRGKGPVTGTTPLSSQDS